MKKENSQKIVNKKQKLTKSVTNTLLQYLRNYLYSLTKLQRRIWKYIQGLQFSCYRVFPGVDTIARKCSCCVRTVQYAMEKFLQYGWIKRERRAYQTNMYFISKELLAYQIVNQESCIKFIRELEQMWHEDPPPLKPPHLERNLHVSCTVFNRVSLDTYRYEDKQQNIESFTEKVDRRPLCLQQQDLFHEEMRAKNPEVYNMIIPFKWISNNDLRYFCSLPPYAVAGGLEKARSQQEFLKTKGVTIDNRAAFLNKKCREEMARQKRGHV